MKINKIDNTIGRRLVGDEMFYLTMEFCNGAKFTYSGKTKKACLIKFMRRWHSFTGFKQMEWIIDNRSK